MTTWIKLCGLRTQDDVQTAVDLDVQAIGFVFARSPRAIEPRVAQALARDVPSSVATVAVMLRPAQHEADAVLEHFKPDFLQADWQSLEHISLPEGVAALPVYRQGDGTGPDDMPPRFVFEGPESGQGQTVDWQAARRFSGEKQLILAGGLTPANVRAAINILAPFGVDVSSGIEKRRGIKDPMRMREFVTEVRAADGLGSPSQI